MRGAGGGAGLELASALRRQLRPNIWECRPTVLAPEYMGTLAFLHGL